MATAELLYISKYFVLPSFYCRNPGAEAARSGRRLAALRAPFSILLQ